MFRRQPAALALSGVTLLLWGMLAPGCSSNPASPSLIVDEISIESVEVLILETFPVQATAHVQGTLGDGCTEFHSLTQSRAGNEITVTILKKRPREAVCIQIAKLYEANIPLQGQYPPGKYLLRVNGFEKAFSTD